MILGFLTGGQLGGLEASLKWASDKGFGSISLTVPPGSKLIDLNEAVSNPTKIKALVSSYDVKISAIGFYGNPISPHPAKRREATEHFLKVVEAAYKLGIPVVTGWLGKVDGSIEDNIKEIKEVWPGILKRVEDYGLKVAIENCPGNIMYRPDIWRAVFDALGTESLGLEFDPSHLICQLIDPIRAADEFGDRIYHVHAKDAQIEWDKVSDLGITSRGWCPHRLPGYGDLDWTAFLSVLKKHGYDYAISIEHEDPYFGYEEGLLRAKKFLEIFVI